MPTRRAALAAAGMAAAGLALPGVLRAQAAALRIGFVTTLSGPGAAVGADIRDGFLLAMPDGRLGGVPVELALRDDGGSPGLAKRILDRFVRLEGLRLYSGIAFSPVLEAVIGEVLDEGGLYLSPAAGPADRAGRLCHPNYYVLSAEDDTPAEAAGADATRRGHGSAWLVVADAPAGRAAAAAFRRGFRGEVAGESRIAPGEPDLAGMLARLRAAGPAVVFAAPADLAGFLRQFRASGLGGAVPLLLPLAGLDAASLALAPEGSAVAAPWNGDFDDVANRRFMADFPARFGRAPGIHAAWAYDTALALGAALFDTHGALEDTEAFRRVMLPAAFESVRGGFRFGRNQHPVQDWWSLAVRRGGDGRARLATVARIFGAHAGAAAGLCRF